MKILLTGSHGFLGKHLMKVLRDKPDTSVVLLHRDRNNSSKDSINKDLLSGTDVVIHLAGVMRDSYENLHEGNTTLTLQLLEAIKLYAPNALVIYASSIQAADNTSFYGITKLYSESLFRWYGLTYGIKSIIFRFPNVYGPFCKPFYNSVVATFIYQIMHKKEIVIRGDGNQKRDFLYVTDVIDVIYKALPSKPKKITSLYNICSGSLVSLNTIVKILRRISPEPVTCRYDVPLKEKRTNRLSNMSARVDFEWKPLVSLEEGLKMNLVEEYGVVYKK